MVDAQMVKEDAVGHDGRLHAAGAVRVAGIDDFVRARRRLNQPFDEIGLVGVSGVKNQDIVAGRAADALVDGVVDAFVRLGRPRGQAVGVAADDVQGFVRAAAVDNDVLDRAIGLGPDALDRLGQGRGAIPHDRDDGHQRHFVVHEGTQFFQRRGLMIRLADRGRPSPGRRPGARLQVTDRPSRPGKRSRSRPAARRREPSPWRAACRRSSACAACRPAWTNPGESRPRSRPRRRSSAPDR
ncbi:hypothetical protein D3C77_179030 [compost metagenome]